MSNGNSAFDIDVSRQYWRFAPSGAGKHDTRELLAMDDATLQRTWNDAFARRFRQYVEEDEFIRAMAAEFRGKRVLSIGPGLGLHELYYQRHGARMTCCDIVESNLKIIARVAALKGIAVPDLIVSTGARHPLGGPYDVVFIYGSLMTMPAASQRDLLAQCMRSLAEDGRVVLMLYTWDFAAETCGWTSPDQFEPQVFARASDPSVGAEHCPWSDWHDEAKLVALTGGAMQVTRSQLWNQRWFLWTELARGPAPREARPFFDPATSDAGARYDLDLAGFHAADAQVQAQESGLAVATGNSPAGYALVSDALSRSALTCTPNALLVGADLDEGGFSVGLLDEAANSFVVSQAIWQRGHGSHLFALPSLPERFRIVLSNHRPSQELSSRFLLHRIALLEHPTVLDDPILRS